MRWPEHWTDEQKAYARLIEFANRYELQAHRVAAGEMRAGAWGAEQEKWRQECEVLDYVIGAKR